MRAPKHATSAPFVSTRSFVWRAAANLWETWPAVVRSGQPGSVYCELVRAARKMRGITEVARCPCAGAAPGKAPGRSCKQSPLDTKLRALFKVS